MRKSRKATVIIGSTVGALAIGGVAFAYWTTSGSGTGDGATTAGVSGLTALSFTQDSLTAMYPGDVQQDLSVTVENTSGESAYVTGVKAYITTDKGASCDGSNFLLNGAAAPSTEATAASLTWTSQDLADGDSDVATGHIQFNNKSGTDGNQDACKDAAVTIHYIAS